jgi:hypothetical protein
MAYHTTFGRNFAAFGKILESVRSVFRIAAAKSPMLSTSGQPERDLAKAWQSTRGVNHMAKLTLATSVLAGVTALCGAAAADSSMVGPTYIGDRAADPEDETFAYLVKTEESDRPLAFIGPARNVGPVTGDPERDTIGYRPLLGVQRDGLWSFVLARE